MTPARECARGSSGCCEGGSRGARRRGGGEHSRGMRGAGESGASLWVGMRPRHPRLHSRNGMECGAVRREARRGRGESWAGPMQWPLGLRLCQDGLSLRFPLSRPLFGSGQARQKRKCIKEAAPWLGYFPTFSYFTANQCSSILGGGKGERVLNG